MDAGYLNFHKEEDFSSYFLDPFQDDSHSIDDPHAFSWVNDNDETELNGDVGLIPGTSGHADDYVPLSSSPPSREDFNKIMNDWNQLVNLDVTEDLIVDVVNPHDELLAPDGFDITKFVVDHPSGDKPPQQHRGKRIDMARQMYLIDEDYDEGCFKSHTEMFEDSSEDEEDYAIDVETVVEDTSQPVLQAGDLKTLLEQFEATESTNLVLHQTHNIMEQEIFEEPASGNVQMAPPTEKIETPPPTVAQIIVDPPTPPQIKPPVLPHPPPSPAVKKEPIRPNKKPVPDEASKTSPAKDQVKSKQILDSLPPELIDRIRQTSKRKPVPVIEPIQPTKKRNTSTAVPARKEAKKEAVQFDHDYCSSTPRSKDSGFSSCEEDEQRSILRTQPTVKNADGKLMVSLLKSNTIKKKLNLEEYKKRLQNRSHGSSGNNSPLPDEDENARRLRHQEKLMLMAQEIVAQQQGGAEVRPKEEKLKPVELPANIVMKTLVSVATNTEESWGHLEQILQNTQLKISPNSLISSIVEHLPKVKPVIERKQTEHGEDKTIVYFDKQRERPKTRSVHVQTAHCSGARRRRRSTSTSSSSSASSRSSSSSGRSESSRSRTPTPVRRRHHEEVQEVEERRVIYVGKIVDGTSKEDLRRRFSRFGPITNVSVHFRRKADNYGFVTFLHKEDAYEAVERGNDCPDLPQYVLSFGGRRLFCKTTYSDLDNVSDDAGYWSPISGTMISTQTNNTFDALLRQAQAKLRKRQL